MNLTTSNKKTSTRDLILQSLKSTPQATVDELAVVADISPVTVRHHLNSLQADGLLLAKSVRRNVGRPHYVYSLSQDGHELFPQKYVRLSTRLIAELKERFSQELVSEIFVSVVKRVVDEHRPFFENLSFEQRLDYVINLLAEEGFLAEWEALADNKYRIIESSCPYISIGQEHSEVCSFDAGLLKEVLEATISQQSCILNGDKCCQFTVVPANEIYVTVSQN